MSSFKGDSRYNAYHDNDSDPDPNHEPEDHAESPTNWVDQHFDALSELYQCFTGSGSVLFGRAFYQFGNFAQFCTFVHANTIP